MKYTEKQLQMMSIDKLINIIMQAQDDRERFIKNLKSNVSTNKTLVDKYHEHNQKADEVFARGCLTTYQDILYELEIEDDEEEEHEELTEES